MKQKKLFGKIALLLALAMLFAIPADVIYAKSSKNISLSKLSKSRVLTLKNMPSASIYSFLKTYKGKKLKTHTIQNFSYTPDLKYIFTVGECNTGSKKHTLLTVSKINKEFGDKNTSTCIDARVLGNYGHGDAIAITERDSSKEIYDVWVASDAGSNGFGRCIDRMTIAIENEKMVIKKKVRIKNFKKANVVNGKAALFEEKEAPKRMNVAADEKNNQIVFRSETSTEINYLAYDLKKLNKALDKKKDGSKYDIAKQAKNQKANVRCNVVPKSVFQSFRVTDNTIYICGGYFNDGAEINTIKYKVYNNGKSVQQDKKFSDNVSKVINLPSTIKIGKRSFKKKNVEVEGMDFVRNEKGKIDVHINYYARGVDVRNGITIFRFGL